MRRPVRDLAIEVFERRKLRVLQSNIRKVIKDEVLPTLLEEASKLLRRSSQASEGKLPSFKRDASKLLELPCF